MTNLVRFFRFTPGGIFFGLCAYALIRSIQQSTAFTNALPLWRPWKGMLGGLLLVILTLLFSRDYLGLGLNLMEGCIKGLHVNWYTFLLKALFTIITLSISRSGSMITSVLFIGATAGSFFADRIGADQSTFAAIGFVSILVGTTNTPIASSILAIELFGATVAPYAAVSCVISFLMSGHRSLYSAQLLAVSKSRAIQVDIGKEIRDLSPVNSRIDIRLSIWLRDVKRLLRKR